MKRLACGVMALALVACQAPLRHTAPSPTRTSSPQSVDELAAAIAESAQRSDRESDPRIRVGLAADASRNADACLALEPGVAACLYGRAVALGLEARAHPTRAGELLKTMLDYLDRAEAAEPGYDNGGPARVRALVLIRAPGWPLGPGDVDAGLTAARRAAKLRPEYPPNRLALAEALAKSGDAKGARENYERARGVAQSLPTGAERDRWLREAEQALGN